MKKLIFDDYQVEVMKHVCDSISKEESLINMTEDLSQFSQAICKMHKYLDSDFDYSNLIEEIGYMIIDQYMIGIKYNINMNDNFTLTYIEYDGLFDVLIAAGTCMKIDMSIVDILILDDRIYSMATKVLEILMTKVDITEAELVSLVHDSIEYKINRMAEEYGYK